MAYKVLTLTDATGQAVAVATVSQDVTERRRLEDDLRKLAADLSEADRRKDEFLATLAHELRNPLAPIRNALQILRLSPDRQASEQARAMMERQLGQMVRLVDDLLDVSRITTGKLELRKERVELSAVVEQCGRDEPPADRPHGPRTHRHAAARSRSSWTPTRPGWPRCSANLLNNAAKYTDRGGHIWLTAERQGSDVVVSVQGHRHRHRRRPAAPHLRDVLAGGPVAGAVAGRAGHRADAGEAAGRDARRPDRGPQRGAGQGVGVRRPAAGRRGGVRAAGGRPRRTSRPAPKSSLRILVVDDNRDGADSLAMLLRIMGNDTRTAYDGQEGVEVAGEFRPDVVLLDIGLPKLNGYEACRRIREQPWGKSVVLIALTGWGQEEDRRRSHEAGFDHHMVKPVDPQELMKLLAGLQTVMA